MPRVSTYSAVQFCGATSDFLALEKRLADQASRDTLYGMLLFRLTYNRANIRDIFFGTSDEYFSDSKFGKTFILGENEYWLFRKSCDSKS